MGQNDPNHLISAFEGEGFGTFDESIPFPKINIADYVPALEMGIALARKNIAQIKADPQPTFTGVVEAYENSSELLETVSSIYHNLFSAEANPEHQALAQEISAKMAAFSSEMSLDEQLFAQINKVKVQSQATLTKEQIELLNKFYRNFVRNGALLNPADKEKLRKIDQELSGLSPKISENILKATNQFQLVVDDKKQLSGLPESLLEAAQHEAAEKGLTGKWLFSLQGPSYVPFMQYADSAELRQKMWTQYNSRGFKGEFDNQELVLKTVKLKNERAQLLGFKSHSEFTLEERMAKSTDRVFNFLTELLTPSKKAAQLDLKELKEFRKSIDGKDELMPWDFGYYSQKLKEKKFHFNDEELRPYFALESVVQGAFEHARKLYGLVFNKQQSVPVYHPDVVVYEVKDEKTNEFIGLFYTDFFPRSTKRGGAWMTSYRDQGIFRNKLRRPHISIVCNFTKSTPTKPSLLTYDEVKTLFHEFGHALHGLLSQCHYRSLAGTSVYWDFVELPSQIMENWVGEKEGLDLFARHYQTQTPIPNELVEKLKNARKFQAGYASLRQLSFALLDMRWHTEDPAKIISVEEFERAALKDLQLFPFVEGTNMSCAFTHIFAGGYSAGYYSYKWAEVLDADAFEFFKANGIFNAEVALKFKTEILTRGGTEHPLTLYRNFRGQDPDPKALLRRDGLVP